MLNVYEQIDSNKRRSTVVIVTFIFLVVGFIWLIEKLFEGGSGLIWIAIIFSLFYSFSSYFWGDKLILALSAAKPASRKEHFNFYTAVENLAIAAQIPTPRLYVINSSAMNAFATGRDPKHAVVCATSGLLENLKKTELEGVIAHEISHVANYDIRLMMIVAILVGMVSMLANSMLRVRNWREDDSDKDHNFGPILIIIGMLMLIISPIVAQLIQLAISRRREYLSDASAIKLTRQPQGLIGALEKLRDYNVPLGTASPATAHLFIVNPLADNRYNLQKLTTVFSTHPPIEDRIAALKRML